MGDGECGAGARPALEHPRRAGAGARAGVRSAALGRRAARAPVGRGGLSTGVRLAGAVARRAARRRLPAGAHRHAGSSTRRCSATRTPPRRGATPPPPSTPGRRGTACCRCRAPSSAPSAGATPSIRRCPVSPSARSSRATCSPSAVRRRWTSLYAFDERFQSGTVERGSIAPIARLLGADRIWLANDAAFDRFRTPARPELDPRPVRRRRARARRARRLTGRRSSNVPDIPMVDEAAVSDDRRRARLPPVELVAVDDPVPVVRAKTDEVVVSGSGDGLVDAAAAGLIDGTELVRYSAASTPTSSPTPRSRRRRLIVTDSNRDRAHHWRSSQDVNGFTEEGGPDADVAATRHRRRTPAGVRVDRRPHADGRRAAGAGRGHGDRLRRAVRLPAGEPAGRWPSTAIRATAWVVGDRAAVLGEYIRLRRRADRPGSRLRQPAGAADRPPRQPRSPSRSTIGHRSTVGLDDRSLGESASGSTSSRRTGGRSRSRSPSPDRGARPDPGPALAAVGFAEIDLGQGPTIEVVRPPVDAASRPSPATSMRPPPIVVALTRLRTRPTTAGVPTPSRRWSVRSRFRGRRPSHRR